MNEQRETTGKWAPWYVYVVVLVGCNLIKQRLIEGVPALVNIAVTAVLAAVLVFAITYIYRSLIARKHRQE